MKIRRFFKIQTLNIDKARKLLIAVNFIEIFTIIMLWIYYKSNIIGELSERKANIVGYLVILFSAIIIINVIISVRNIWVISISKKEVEIQKANIQRINQLNNTLRGQRHDFLNNLQVVYSLIQMGEFEDSKEYIEEVYKDIKKVSKILRTSNAAINALIQAKIVDAEEKNINMSLKISSRLDYIKNRSWEICRILSNLLDNAIYELNNCDIDNKSITLEIYEELSWYIFNVKNTGPKIDEKILNRIFEPSFTTKGSKGQGMGLAIVKEIIENQKGTIVVRSDNEGTSFKFKIPINFEVEQ
ncbi:sensor histidine kinase [Oceanirhabdus sp. W0125-5]|uniref:sensor histidine kinase n=1 Tax=Oceanirhabdus sp. W0125-5 TaxID=2999116 RepID=UPI0022F2CE72|nr:ATP-binding protein [Oceanirhabdus sp. W0125-5]WBW97564.1 Spo0B domain-containing protein [Oceanirhabdus sp. W0125-5]